MHSYDMPPDIGLFLAEKPNELCRGKWGRINASTDLPLKHARNKLYKELILQHLVLQLFDDSRKGSTRFVSTGIRPTTIWIYRIKFYKNRLYRK